jgi:hypothetical protein
MIPMFAASLLRYCRGKKERLVCFSPVAEERGNKNLRLILELFVAINMIMHLEKGSCEKSSDKRHDDVNPHVLGVF